MSLKSPFTVPKVAILIDGDTAACKTVADHLMAAGAGEVLAYPNGEAAAADLNRADVELVLIDWSLTAPSGRQILEALRESSLHQRTPVLVVAGSIDPEDEVWIAGLPLTAVEIKPLGQAALDRVFGQIRGGGAAKPKAATGSIPASANEVVEEMVDDDLELLDPELLGMGPSPAAATPAAPKEKDPGKRAVLAGIDVLGGHYDVLSPALALIAEPDRAQAQMIGSYLRECGTRSFDVVTDGVAAWELFDSRRYDLVVMDWNLKKLTSLCLYNRIRKKDGSRPVPVIVTSGKIREADFRILGEHAQTSFIRKPFQVEEFLEHLRKNLKSAMSFDIVSAKVHATFGADSLGGDVVRLLTQASKDVPDVFQFLVQSGRFFADRGRLDLAEEVLSVAHRKRPDSLTAMTELARVFHLTDRPDKAIAVLKKAHVLSPQNVERLCLMGQVGLTLADVAGAGRYFDEALAIDAQELKAQKGKRLTKNLGEYLQKPREQQPVWKSFASMLNTVAVTMVREGRIDAGITQYKSAEVFIRDDATRARLHFNLGLAFLRKRETAEARKWLQSAVSLYPGQFEKAARYLEMVSGPRNPGGTILDDDSLENIDFEAIEAELDDIAEMELIA